MGKETTSTTRKSETELLGGGYNYTTKISNGTDYVKGEGTTPEKSQAAASKKWKK